MSVMCVSLKFQGPFTFHIRYRSLPTCTMCMYVPVANVLAPESIHR